MDIPSKSHGIISQATYNPSPNWDERPSEHIDLLVIHGISLPPGEFGGRFVHDLFANQLDPARHDYFKEIAHIKVSSHLFIDRLGELWQFVPFHKRAWHAGKSVFQGRENCNDFSIGIELEGTDTEPYTDAQYKTLTEATVAILETYPLISLDKIVGHSDIAPDRKTDPGSAFNWENYRKRLAYLLESKHIS